MSRPIPRAPVVLALLLAGAAAVADITVKGTVYYWNGHERDEKAGTIGAWMPAANTEVDVENDCLAVGDITTYTDWTGQYSVTFQQRFFRPDFNHLRVDIEVRAKVRLEQADIVANGTTQDVSVACYKTNYFLDTIDVGGPMRLFPYNGQTADLYIKDNETRTINVYVGPKECPDPPAATIPNTSNLRVTSWDYGDDGRRTTAAIFITQCCYEEYRFLVQNCADKKELRRSTSIFYPAKKSAYVFKPQEGAWIDMQKRDLFKDEEARDEERWGNWQDLRCATIHEHGHKLMHDVYWTLPKPYPWGHSGNPFSDDASEHDPLSCKTAEMGICEGWADFLPAVLQRSPTLNGERAFTTATGYVHSGYNIEQAWFPGMPKTPADARYTDVPGNVAWRGDVTGRRDWNESEVAAVLWDIYDGTGWEYMPKAEQDAKPAAWPGDLQWYDRLTDFKLQRIWAILRQEPECLNDEGEMAINRDSIWTFWLDKYGNDKELVHGLKAILHNRQIPHALRPQHAPEIKKVRVLPGCSTLLFADLTVKEADEEDRPFLYYNIAYGKGAANPLKLMFEGDRPLEGAWSGDQLAARIHLPARDQWDRLIVKVHDSMTCAFAQSGDATWQDDSQGAGPRLRLICAVGWEPRIAAVGAGGTVWTWGSSQGGCPRTIAQVTKYSSAWRSRANPVAGLDGVVAIACSSAHYVALKSDGTVWAWGTLGNESGALGIGDQKPAPNYAPNQVPDLKEVVAVDASIGVSMALKSDGTVWGWGYNAGYNLGDGTRIRRKSPVQVQGLPKKITAISTCGAFTLAVDADGEVWIWGDPAPAVFMEAGLGAYTQPLAKPGKVPALRDIVDVVAGRPMLALDKQGAVWEVASRDYFTQSKGGRGPGRVPGLPKVAAIAGGSDLRVALAEDSQLWTWGPTNVHGRLGDPKRQKAEECIKPAPVATIRGWVAIATGGSFGVAIHQQGYAVAWGYGNARGDGAWEDTDLPCAVKTHTCRVPPRPGPDPEFNPLPLWLFH